MVAVARAIASLPFPLNLAAGAATIAALAAIGVRIAGGGGRGRVGANDNIDASVATAQGYVAADERARDIAAQSASKVEIRVTADREGLNAYIVKTAGDVAEPIARSASAQMGKTVLNTSRRSMPGLQQSQHRLGTS